jgi:hypothetical protein
MLAPSPTERNPMFNFYGDLTTDEYFNDQIIWGDDYDMDDWDMTDVEADADTLASAGWGTDEDYGYYGGEDAAMEAGLFGWDA